MLSRRRDLALVLGVLLLAGAALADNSTFPMDDLLGSYSAQPGQHLRTDGLTLPTQLGTVTDVFIRCSGVYLPGETRDGDGVPYPWGAELVFFLQVGGESYWTVLTPDEGAFNLTGTFVSPAGSPTASWPLTGGADLVVDAVLLASGDDGRTIVRFPAATLTSAVLEVHSTVAGETTSWSELKNLYR